MTPSLVASLLLVSQEADAKIDLEFSGARLSVLVDEINKKSGEKFVVREDMANEVVSIWVKGMPVSEVQERIADVSYGKWIDGAQGVTLISDTDRIRRESVASQNELRERIRLAKAAMRDLQNGSFAFPEGVDDDLAMSMVQAWNSSESKLWLAAAAQIPEQLLLDIGEGDRVVFSTTPTAMQRSMSGAGMAPLLNTWITERNAQVEEMLQAMDGQDMDGEEGQMMGMLMDMMGDRMRPKKIEGQPSKVIAVVTTGSGGFNPFGNSGAGEIRISVRALDAEGKVLIDHSAGYFDVLQAQDRADRIREANPDGVADPEEVGGDLEQEEQQAQPEMLELPEASQKYRKALMALNPGESVEPKDPAAMEMVLNPAEYEPLGLVLGEAMMAYAKKKDEPYVAALADSDFQGATWQFMDSQVLADMVEGYFREDDEVTRVNGVLTRRLDNPLEARAERVRRDDLGVIVRTSYRDLAVPLDTLANFAARNPGSKDNAVVTILRNAVMPNMQELFGEVNDWETLVFWGSLSNGQRSTLRRGEQVPFSMLSGQARQWLTKRTFGGEQKIGPIAEMGHRPMWERMGEMMEGGMGMGAMFGGSAEVGADEPTEQLPRGLPANGYLQANIQKDKYLVQVGKDGKPIGLSMAMGAGELAFIAEILKVIPADQADGVSVDSFNKMAVGQREIIDLAAVVAPQTGLVFSLIDDQKPDVSQTYTFANLPSDVATDVETAKKKMAESPMMRMMMMFMRMGGGMGGSQRVDPPLN